MKVQRTTCIKPNMMSCLPDRWDRCAPTPGCCTPPLRARSTIRTHFPSSPTAIRPKTAPAAAHSSDRSSQTALVLQALGKVTIKARSSQLVRRLYDTWRSSHSAHPRRRAGLARYSGDFTETARDCLQLAAGTATLWGVERVSGCPGNPPSSVSARRIHTCHVV